MKEDIYFRVNCFYYYALSNSLYLIFYLLPYDSQITNQVFHLWIILKTRPSHISFRLSLFHHILNYTLSNQNCGIF